MSKKKETKVYDIPKKLKAKQEFLALLSLSAVDMFKSLLTVLDNYGYKDIDKYEHPTDGYIFARGVQPVCLCAHLDVVPHYEPVKKIEERCVLSSKVEDKVIDVYLHSNQGIGGDDRCGVYAILKMLEYGHRPSVLFCMGEEIGCCGSRKFCSDHDKDFLKGVNAFVQIDRRGRTDCVRYSDTNEDLTLAVCKFGYKHAHGSCSDISRLMPHFGISGVNLSSGYYHEHSKQNEFISMSDVRYLLNNLHKMLSSNIFDTKYEYKPMCYSHYNYDSRKSFNNCLGLDEDDSDNHNGYEQLSLGLDYGNSEDYGVCDMCGSMVEKSKLVDVDLDIVEVVCPDCARLLKREEEIMECPSCGSLINKERFKGESSFVEHHCPYCQAVIDFENNN